MKTSSYAAMLTGVLAAVAALLLGTALATPAFAHTTLKRSDPKKDAKVESLERVELEFTQPVRLPTVILRGPGGKTFHSGKPEVDERIVTQDVADDLPAGKYTIAYRVVSPDGHPVEGEIPFTIVAPEPEETPAADGDATASPEATAAQTPAASESAAAPAASAEPSEPSGGAGQDAAPASAEQGSGGVPAWMWMVVFGLAGVGIGLAISLRPKRTGGQAGGDGTAGKTAEEQ
jgi:Uncharacterized protein, homolog of Cu resistance protein CopC